MSYQEVKEKIKVLAVFKNGTIFPFIFEWNNRRYRVLKVNLAYQERDGVSIDYYYAVEAQNRASASRSNLVAKLKYNDKAMDWSLEDVWSD